jgi:group I intron endonuclease
MITSIYSSALARKWVTILMLLCFGVLILLIESIGSGAWAYYSLSQETTFFIECNDFTTSTAVKNLFLSVLPIKTYANSDLQKSSIISENRKKSGIYRWVNNLTGDFYIGSAVDLTARFYSYFSAKYLEAALAKSNSIIYRALLKYGYSAFSLEILEYCDPGMLLEREQHYIDTLNPSYNILTIAGSPLGRKHTEESKAKMSDSKQGVYEAENNPMYGKTHTTETKSIMSQAKKGKYDGLNNPMFGRTGEKNPMHGVSHSEKTRAQISATLSRPVDVYNAETMEIIEQYSGVVVASKALHMSTATLYKYLNTGDPYKGLIFRDKA